MFQFLPMIAGLLQGQGKKQEQQKQDRIGAMLGKAPMAGADSGNGGGAGMLQAIGGMMGGQKAPKSNPMSDVDNAMAGFGGGKQDYSAFLSHDEPDADDMGGKSDSDIDDYLR